ncbi:MAG TPA: alpha/beta hydrolase domain-containing protein [Acidimicrobiales bacterium]|nr:alpha/beta hydrolase domain-containing protein [Acidimicrobiales bacterium]
MTSGPSFEALTGGRAPFVAGTAFELGPLGYDAGEYAFAGSASAYRRQGGGLAVVEEADFVTRVLVHRPSDPSAFNGTVWVEWLNVSGGLDAAPAWLLAHTEMMRRGAAWVGVSAQQLGVMGGTSILGMSSPGLVGTDPDRYRGLHHPGDRFSYDIYAQASSALRRVTGTVLDDLSVERVLAVGDSQSAFRLTTFVNDIDPMTGAHDGFLIQARVGATGPLDDEGDPDAIRNGPPVAFRDDLRVPVLCVESETDLMTLNFLAARQDDAERFCLWEIAGTSHADAYVFAVGAIDTGTLPVDELARAWAPRRDLFGMTLDHPYNTGPQHYVRNAAAAHLDTWVTDGVRPPTSDRLEVRDGEFVTDDLGNVRGGIRTPHVDAPVAVLSGLGNGGAPISFLCGRTVPFDDATLRALYSSRDDYLGRFGDATEAAVAAGFVLADDAAEIIAIAGRTSPL